MDEINRIDMVILLVPRRNYVQLLNLMFLLVGQDKATSNTYSIAFKALENRNLCQNKKNFVR